MKLNALTGDADFDIEISWEDSRILADINGRRYNLEASVPERGIYLLKYENKIYEVSITAPDLNSGMLHANVGVDSFDISLVDPKRLRGSGSDGRAADGTAEIKTSMPGKVVRVLIKEGDEVLRDDGILVVEAMKMQNEMKSPKDGTVTEIRFSEGETVNAGDVLAIIE